MSSPLTKVRLSRLLWWVLSGSEKEPDGGERKGGGNGRGGLFAKSERPVSNRKGAVLLWAGWVSSVSAIAVVENALGRHGWELWMSERGRYERIERASLARSTDLLIPASVARDVRWETGNWRQRVRKEGRERSRINAGVSQQLLLNVKVLIKSDYII
jgi:hypothetical protein